MRWKKLGLVFSQDGKENWKKTSALTPTPILLDNKTIRIYAGFRDEGGISRIGFVDVDADNPLIIKNVSDKPVLDTGRVGCFDDNGVILGDVVSHNGKLRMYYVGFQLVKRVKFLAFTGMAESTDGGDTFVKVSETPVMDRREGANTICAIHTALFENDMWKVWYAAGNNWQVIDGKDYPKYNIWYTESRDGISFNGKSYLCVDVDDDEYRIGRPSVFKKNDVYLMFYTKGSVSGKDYSPGLAYSYDGIVWTRRDKELNLELSPNGFDSLHLCYPRLLKTQTKVFAFYNGNNMGQEGFGVAELLEW